MRPTLAVPLLIAAASQPMRAQELPTPRSVAAPWVVIDRPEPERYDVLVNPQLLLRRDGSYVVTVEHRGHYNSQIGTYVYLSADRGATWTKLASLPSPRYGSLFESREVLYILGIDGSGRGDMGAVCFRRSVDGGATWSEQKLPQTWGMPTRIHAMFAPVVLQTGRVWRAFHRQWIEGGRMSTNVFVASASDSADLLDPASWSWSDEFSLAHLARYTLVATAAQAPIVLAENAPGSVQTVVDISPDGCSLRSRVGSSLRIPPRALGRKPARDVATGEWLFLSNADDPGSDGGSTEIGLVASTDLVSWEPRSTLLTGSPVRFGYATESVVEGSDLLVVLVAEIPSTDAALRGNPCWAPLFLRVPKFRERTPQTPPLWDASVR